MMDKDATRFRVLLAEDDAVSREFLCEAIRACGGDPIACVDGPTALDRAREGQWNLLVLDHHLPGMNGEAVLAALRADPGAATPFPPALATTAEPGSARALLLEAGFAQVLPKPVSLETLRAALAPFGCVAGPLDDGNALRACGSVSAVERLRRLFAEQELPRIHDEFECHAADPQALRPTLHRLLASCGFCGATALAHACSALHDALASGDAGRIDPAMKDFAKALHETRDKLHSKLNGNPD
jgi:CheY-like chemotaxis protein/HPt (histidine-containing phosphotransfer) domain-containing protein